MKILSSGRIHNPTDSLASASTFLLGENRCTYHCTSKRSTPSAIAATVALLVFVFALILIFVTYLTSLQLSHHQPPPKIKPYITLTPENSFIYSNHVSKLLKLTESTTHINGTPHKSHGLELEIFNGIFTYRNSTNTYPSTPITKSDYKLLQKARKSLGIPICQHWFENSGFFPVTYDCTLRLVKSIPINMDVGSSSNAGINYLDARHVSTPTLLASTGLFILIQIIFLLCACCCSCFSSCAGYGLAIQKTKKSKSDSYRSFDPQLSSILHATAPQQQTPRAGHL